MRENILFFDRLETVVTGGQDYECRYIQSSLGFFKKAASYHTGNISLKKILDVCTGHGKCLNTFLQASNGWEAYGVDGSEVLLNKASKTGIPKANLTLLDVDTSPLPFASEEFDVTTIFNSIRYLENPYDTVREMIRVTKLGGIIAIGGITFYLDERNRKHEAILTTQGEEFPVVHFSMNEERFSKILSENNIYVHEHEIYQPPGDSPEYHFYFLQKELN